jgi:SpoVK/Ycf46/Vps4 family AAA+-type ATPase
LFAGPSGTGKTMAAQVLANSLDLDLYRVDLAEVVNKYIGETEKRLSNLFDECEHAKVVVFFDEADALFGQRTRVRDAHDRFANIEIDYLLQRMETFNGVAILATNRKGDLDDAFLRRLRTIVDFPVPTEIERHALWERVLPDHAPDGSRLTEGVDRVVLARRLDLTGAEITSIALAAAFLARHHGRPIGLSHLETAANRELAKRGTVLRTPLSGGKPR